MAYKAQRIRDPVHDLISFKADEFENAMWDVIESRPFQRLRRIKQLGFSDLVYPGATHSRFAHSVGVFHTARRLERIIKTHVQGFQETKARIAIAASLVHDLGHGPFSHAFEDVGERLNLKLASHEAVSQMLIRDSEVAEKLKNLGGGFHGDVADVIASDAPRTIYDAVVSSQFDADRLDYMRRDRMMAGSSHGVIDYEWLLSNLEIGKIEVGVDQEKTGELETFVVGPKAVYAAEAYVLGLFQLYPTIYYHKTTRGAEKIFTELFVHVFQLIINENIDKTGLSSIHPIVKFAKDPANIDCVLALDDTVIWGALQQIQYAEDKKSASLAERLLKRKLLKAFDVREEIKRKLRETKANPEEVEDITDRISVKVVEKAELWRGTQKQSLVLFDKLTRSPYKRFHESKGPLNQIMVRETGGRLVDLAEFSPVVRAIRPFEVVRYYFDKDDTKSRETLSSIIEGETST